MASYDQALAEIQQILSHDDPAAISLPNPNSSSCIGPTSRAMS